MSELGSVLIVMSTNREPKRDTKASLRTMREHGAALLMAEGHSDVTQARNHSLSMACDVLRGSPERDCVLMLDDDMVVPLEVALALVSEALSSGFACSAVYATAGGKIAGGRWRAPSGGDWPDGLRKRWQMGLGCLAVPSRLLLELESRSESYEVPDRVLTQFTWSKAERGSWVAEDYRLCRELGGVRVLPLGVGHIKEGGLWPDEETLAAIREDRPVRKLPGGALQE